MTNEDVLWIKKSLDRHGAELEQIESICDPICGEIRVQLDATKVTRASALILYEDCCSHTVDTWGLSRKRLIVAWREFCLQLKIARRLMEQNHLYRMSSIM